MAFEMLKAQVYSILDEIVARPSDRHILQEKLRETLSELRTQGLPLPEDLQRLEKELQDEAADETYPRVTDV